MKKFLANSVDVLSSLTLTVILIATLALSALINILEKGIISFLENYKCVYSFCVLWSALPLG